MESSELVDRLKKTATEIRKDVIRSLASAGSGHLGGSLGLADVFTVLYFHQLRHKPDYPDWPDRDRLVLSIGHVAPLLYASLAHSGYFPKEELLTLRKLGSRLQGHPGRDHGLPGIELSAGSLGQGLSVAVGMAIAAKLDGKSLKVYAVLGDGELQEGAVWEAAMSAAHHKLGNLLAIVDRNKVQIDGKVSQVMEIEPLTDKWKAFGWHVIECDGNDIQSLLSSFAEAEKIKQKPVVIIAHTKMGKGVKAIEDDYRWHGKAPGEKEVNYFISLLLNT
ncbi:MAG TPA: transketolase [Bacteroidales bacterium]|nr:transketolase [Bacteroidales bacterium]HPR58029.1 transketolase [Bacteroidales bacterium]HRW96108.1 transketolase [Bacteroidales bacterium]